MSRHSTPVTVRFLAYINEGFVKIALKDGQALAHCSGGATDEGYSYHTTRWERENDTIHRESSTIARDCDGRLDHHHNSAVSIWELAEYETPDGTLTPNWGEVSCSQRDYAAEAAGY